MWCRTVWSRRAAGIWKRGGFFEKVRKVQTTLTRIFIVLESKSHGLSENWDGISPKARKFKRFFFLQKKKVFTEIETDFSARIGNSNVFSAQKQVVPPPKKRSPPKLRLIFRLKSEIQTLFQAEARHVLHNFGTQFPLGGAVFNFSPKIGLKSTKNVRICILHMPMPTPPLPPPPPGYATGLEGKKPLKRYYLMLIFVKGANCRCLHFCFLVVNALNLFLV